MRFLQYFLFALLVLPVATTAQDTGAQFETGDMQEVVWDLTDAGILNHPRHGRGIEMRIKPTPMPDGLFEDEAVFGLMASLCDHYAPIVISFVRDQGGLSVPDFVAVRLISGNGSTGQYVLQAYTIDDLQCGDALQ